MRPDAAAPRRPAPPRPARDLRLDVLRGWLQLTIFMAHAALIAPGSTRIGGWIVHTAWGYSDSSEQFVFTSGLGLGSLFALKCARDGFAAAQSDLLRRTFLLYRTHLALFAVFAVLVLFGAFGLGLRDDIPRMGFAPLLAAPVETLAGVPLFLFQPQFMDILPVFIVCMALLGPFMALLERVGNAALLLPVGLYAATHAFGLVLPALRPDGATGWGFNPLAWQVLFLLGAFLGRRALLGQGPAVPRHGLAVAGSLAILAWGFLVRIATYGWWPVAWLPFGWVPPLDWLIIKENLGPVLLLHGLALAYLCAVLLPREAAIWSRGPFPRLAAVGRHSLQSFCVGLCLSWGVGVALRKLGYSYALDAALLAAGCALLLAFGAFMEGQRRAVPARSPA